MQILISTNWTGLVNSRGHGTHQSTILPFQYHKTLVSLKCVAQYSSTAASAQLPANANRTTRCRRCKQPFIPSENHSTACKYHPQMFTGGELAKAIGFVRESDRPEHQLINVHGRTGLIQFWDCCGAGSQDAGGCSSGRHLTYDDPDD